MPSSIVLVDPVRVDCQCVSRPTMKDSSRSCEKKFRVYYANEVAIKFCPGPLQSEFL
jgi:hypothetical protein